MTNEDAALNLLGYVGTMLSSSKSMYGDRYRTHIIFFNANVYDSDGQKIWYGDIDLTKDRKNLEELAKKIGPFYVTREMPFRFENVTKEMLERAVAPKKYPDAYLVKPGESFIVAKVEAPK